MGNEGDKGYKKLVGYKYLKSYQLATVIYDLTIKFCNRYISKSSRTHDQIVQAARSGKQNIAEGYLEKSLKMYIKWAGVSRGSLCELLEDYEDYARQNGIPVWSVEKSREIGDIKERYTPILHISQISLIRSRYQSIFLSL